MNSTNSLNKTTSEGHHHTEVSLSVAQKPLFAIGSMMSRMSFSNTNSISQINGLKRTYIYMHLPKNFRMNSMLAGLCNLCNDFGHSNFDSLHALLDDLNCQSVLNTPLSSLTITVKFQETMTVSMH